MEVLDRYAVRATAAVDAAVATRYPAVIEQCQERDWEFVAHGQTVNRMITSRLDEHAEREYIRSSLADITRGTGRRPQGWLGPEYGESARTPPLLAEQGLAYLLDWPNDEQPYWMTTPAGNILSIPIMAELDDTVCYGRHITVERWRRMVTEAFDVLFTREPRRAGCSS
jgi:peptidoglycan/xylan/chitin deacetylase (PgdA/CDA1 family)